MKKELHDDYAALCNASTPASDELFGDLTKLTKDIQEANKVAKKVKRERRSPNYASTHQRYTPKRRYNSYNKTRNERDFRWGRGKKDRRKQQDKGVLVGSSHQPDEFISNIFLRKKRDGTYRMILNLKELNKFIVYHHFKMDSLHAATELMTPGCFMASIDLKDAYYTVPIHPDFQKYLKFKFNGKLYQYTCLPNGLSSAPRLFTKLMKPVYATLREQGHTNLGYIDDSLLLGDTVTECASSVRATKDLVEHVGFTPHLEKSIFAPTQIIVFLGFTLNSITMTVTPTQDKVMKTRQCCLALLAKQTPTIQDLAEVIGVLVANFPGVEFGPLHYRNLEKDKVQALTASKGSYQGLVQLRNPLRSCSGG